MLVLENVKLVIQDIPLLIPINLNPMLMVPVQMPVKRSASPTPNSIQTNSAMPTAMLISPATDAAMASPTIRFWKDAQPPPMQALVVTLPLLLEEKLSVWAVKSDTHWFTQILAPLVFVSHLLKNAPYFQPLDALFVSTDSNLSTTSASSCHQTVTKSILKESALPARSDLQSTPMANALEQAKTPVHLVKSHQTESAFQSKCPLPFAWDTQSTASANNAIKERLHLPMDCHAST